MSSVWTRRMPTPDPLTDDVVQAADYVITMGGGDTCSIYPGRKTYRDRNVKNPEEKTVAGDLLKG